MSQEQEKPALVVTGIHINLKEGSIVFEAEDDSGKTQTLAAEGVIFRQPLPELKLAPQSKDSPTAIPEKAEAERIGPEEKDPRLTLTGRLKNKPREGRPDRSGKATAYARFAAHMEGEGQSHDYIATFHRHTARIALNLAKDAQITVDGYPHTSASQKRLDTFSVINLLNYPGMPKKK